MPSIYYIDGYNVIHHSSLLQPLAKQSFETAREALIEKVARFCAATGAPAKIVFDGRGRRTEPSPPSQSTPGLEVLYSPGHKTADALIERIVYTAADRRSIIVVSGDRGIRTLCRSLGALVMEPDNFLSTIRESDRETRATLENLQRADALHRMEHRLSEDQIQRLRNIKKKLEE